MKVLNVGGGAREHSVVDALKRSNAEIYTVMKNKNPGIVEASVDFVLMDECEVEKVADWAVSKGVELADHRHGNILEEVIQLVERRLVRQQDRRDPPAVLGPQRFIASRSPLMAAATISS